LGDCLVDGAAAVEFDCVLEKELDRAAVDWIFEAAGVVELEAVLVALRVDVLGT